MTILAAILLVVFVVVSWGSQFVGLPGTWMIVGAAALYAWLVPPESYLAITWATVAVLAVLAVVGEVLEFVAGAAGVSTAGGSRRGAVLAILGSIVGGIIGMFVGLPVPVIGSVLAAVLFGGLGALAGAVVGETWKGRDLDTSLVIGKAAFVGRLLGTVAKVIVCTLMTVVTIGAVVIP
ncbi:MAG: DUF456 domain-containing protein [Planctomycetota bacterium]|nr:MAG: DUF456 domain-containing protein [Planctomycetota bacterium]